jgi:hypothetical protein
MGIASFNFRALDLLGQFLINKVAIESVIGMAFIIGFLNFRLSKIFPVIGA